MVFTRCNKHTQKFCTSVFQRATNLLLRPAGHGQQLQPRQGLGPLLGPLLGPPPGPLLVPRLGLDGLVLGVGARSVSPGAGQNQASPAAPAHRRSAELEGRRQDLLVLLVGMVLRNRSGHSREHVKQEKVASTGVSVLEKYEWNKSKSRNAEMAGFDTSH